MLEASEEGIEFGERNTMQSLQCFEGLNSGCECLLMLKWRYGNWQ